LILINKYVVLLTLYQLTRLYYATGMAQFKVKFKLIATSKPTLAPRLPVHSAVSHVGFMMVCRMDIAYMNTGISSA